MPRWAPQLGGRALEKRARTSKSLTCSKKPDFTSGHMRRRVQCIPSSKVCARPDNSTEELSLSRQLDQNNRNEQPSRALSQRSHGSTSALPCLLLFRSADRPAHHRASTASLPARFNFNFRPFRWGESASRSKPIASPYIPPVSSAPFCRWLQPASAIVAPTTVQLPNPPQTPSSANRPTHITSRPEKNQSFSRSDCLGSVARKTQTQSKRP